MDKLAELERRIAAIETRHVLEDEAAKESKPRMDALLAKVRALRAYQMNPKKAVKAPPASVH